MGFFSKLCAVSNLPVMSERAGLPDFSEVVALFPSGSILRGSYDGYGRIEGVSLMDDSRYDFDDAKFVLAKFFKPGTTYDQLPVSQYDPGQGWFYSDDDLLRWMAQGGFKSVNEFNEAFNRANSEVPSGG